MVCAGRADPTSAKRERFISALLFSGLMNGYMLSLYNPDTDILECSLFDMLI